MNDQVSNSDDRTSRNTLVGSPTGEIVALASDAPLTDPGHDAFGYAQFAQAIANAARTTPSPQGLVLAIYAPWGYGKSTFLNFVKHYISHCSKEENAGTSVPVLIDFNPWWFTDREQLATQFLTQFRARLPHENPALMAIGNAMATYSDALGHAVSVSVSGGNPIVAKLVSWGLKMLKARPKDVPKLKAEVSNALRLCNQRFVVVIDDIDRLTPDEIREVFKVIKAVADFPNVIYLLAFDRQIVAEALCTSLGIKDGEAYLEKIVQALFSLPAVPHDQVLQRLIDELNRLFGEADDPAFQSGRWGNIYREGISKIIDSPRDIVRFINALSITFPAVCGEVSAVDFIAMECLRVFAPLGYETVRENPDRFTGSTPRDERGKREQEKQFHEAWLASLPEDRREPVKGMLEHLFPRMQALWGNMFHAASRVREWNAEARVCAPDMFATYFQFGVAQGRLTRAELRSLIALGTDLDAITRVWLDAIANIRSDGSSKARELLNRLIEIDDLPEEFARTCLKAAFMFGDAFLKNSRERLPGFFSIAPSIQIYWLVHHLTKRLPATDREMAIVDCMHTAIAVAVSVEIAHSVDQMLQPSSEERDSVFQEFKPETAVKLKSLAVDHLRKAARDGTLLDLPDLAALLRRWHDWSNPIEVQTWIQGVVTAPGSLLRLLGHYLRVGSSSTGDSVRRTVSMNPRYFEPLLLPPFDLDALEREVRAAGWNPGLSESERECVTEFQRGMDLIRKGSDPDNPFNQMDLNS